MGLVLLDTTKIKVYKGVLNCTSIRHMWTREIKHVSSAIQCNRFVTLYLLNPSTYGHGTASLNAAITGVYKCLLKCGNIFIPFGAVLVCYWTHPILAQPVHTNICCNFILLAVVGIFSHLVWETIIKISCQLRTLHCCSSRSEVQFKWKDAWHSRGLSPATNLNLRTSCLLVKQSTLNLVNVWSLA